VISPFFRAPIAAAKQPTRQTVHPRTGASPLPRGGPRCASGAAGAGGEGTAHGELQRAGGEGPCRLRDGDCTGWSHLEAPRGWRCRGKSSYRPVATRLCCLNLRTPSLPLPLPACPPAGPSHCPTLLPLRRQVAPASNARSRQSTAPQWLTERES
jgi:hypothetical protein